MVTTRLLQILPPHYAKAMLLTLYFGIRKSEVFGLTRAHVDFARGGLLFRAEEVKSNRDEFLPRGRDAMAFLALLAGEAAMRGHETLIARRKMKVPDTIPRRVKTTSRPPAPTD